MKFYEKKNQNLEICVSLWKLADSGKDERQNKID